MGSLQECYTEESAEEVRELESDLEERFEESPELESEEESEPCVVGVGKIVNLERLENDRVRVKVELNGLDESFSEELHLPKEDSNIHNKWNSLCYYVGLDDPSKARELMFTDVPIVREDENSEWRLDTPSKQTLTSYLRFKLRRWVTSTDRIVINYARRNRMEVLFIVSAVIMFFSLYGVLNTRNEWYNITIRPFMASWQIFIGCCFVGSFMIAFVSGFSLFIDFLSKANKYLGRKT